MSRRRSGGGRLTPGRLVVGLAAFSACEPGERQPDVASYFAEDPPERIVSLIPATTEILFALGAGSRLVGRTHWGTRPPEARHVPNVGNGIPPSIEAVVAREPDLVVMYGSQTTQPAADRLSELGIPVLFIRHDTIDDLKRNVRVLGRIVGCPEGGELLAAHIDRSLAEVADATRDLPPVRVYYDAWADPPITIGRGSYLNELISAAGGENVFGDLQAPSPRVSLEAIVGRDPDRILVAVPGDALDEDPGLGARPGWGEIPAVRDGRISTLDMSLISRLGPGLADAAWSMAHTLHQGLETPARTFPVLDCALSPGRG